MEFILVRHGIAENNAATDADRALTAEGTKKIARVAFGIGSMLKKNAKICIWSSPLLRAMQTAQILSGQLKVDKIKMVDGLATGEDIVPLLSEWIAEKKSDVLIIASHQPFLTEWSVRLTNVPLPFKKGAAACYNIQKDSPLGANLRWFVQPGAWPGSS